MIELEIDGAEHARRLAADLARVDVASHLRKRFDRLGDDIAHQVQAAARGIPSAGHGHTGVRAAIADATRYELPPSGSSPRLVIMVDVGKMGPGRYAMPRAFEKVEFHHPVYGRGRVTQRGHPYFAPVIRRNTRRIREAVAAAVADANRILGRG